MSEKIVSVNPDFFSLSSKRKRRSEKPAGNPKPDKARQLTNTLKQSIIKMMRKHNHDKYMQEAKLRNEDVNGSGIGSGSGTGSGAGTGSVASLGPATTNLGSNEPDDSEFAQSIDFLANLSDTVRAKAQQSAAPVQRLVSTNTPNAVPLQSHLQSHSHTLRSHPQTLQSQPVHKVTTVNDGAMYNRPGVRPMYGVLKQGSLPTYRTWFNRTKRGIGGLGGGGGERGREKTQEKTQIPMSEEQRAYRNQLENNIKQASLAKQMARLNELYRESAAPVPPASSPGVSSVPSSMPSSGPNASTPTPVKKRYIPIQKRTVRRIFQVGKHQDKPSITVLLSNRTIRANTTLANQKAKQVPIQEVRKFLVRRKLVQPGSDVPNDILRGMYENANMIAGEITGK